jgi:hypothetical protein
MKKRYIISTILTGVILGISSKIWLIHKGIHHYRFEFLTFLIILICGFLGAIKITQYLVDFKEIKHKSRIEIIFLAVFFTMLFIPMSHISKKDVSKYENRTLAKWHPLILKNGQFNYDFGKNFDEWFSDRFGMRKVLVPLGNRIYKNSKNEIKKYIIDTKTLFIYGNGHFIVPSKDELLKNFESVNRFNTYLQENNIKLYVLLVPNKYQVHTPSFQKVNDTEMTETIKELNKQYSFKIIYPLEELKEASKKDSIYFKTDHHWTDYGAFIGYQKLMKEIQKDYPNVKIAKENDFDYFYRKDVRSDFGRDFHEGETCRQLHVPEDECNKSLNVDYKYFKHKDVDNLQTEVIEEPFHRGKIFQYPNGTNLRVMLLGTSMSEDLSEILPYSFKNTYRLRINDVKKLPTSEEYKIMKLYKNRILDYKPDILILCIVPTNIHRLKDFFKE